MRYLFSMLFLPFSSFASVDIAFIEVKNYYGQVVQFEPGGQFAHIAISYRGQWLHAHPVRGVEVLSERELERMGVVKAVISIAEMKTLDEALVGRFMSKPYDAAFDWNDDAIYCSELVGKLLGISPKPMEFHADLWPSKFHALRGRPGLSPDDVFKYLQMSGR